MKITHVETYRITPKGDTWIWLEVRTDSGITGWGEASESKNDALLAQYVTAMSQNLIGMDPREITKCTQKFYTWSFPNVTSDRVISTAWSALDQALWDITAQSLSVPLYHLLGGRGNSQINLYANLNRGLRNADRSPGTFALTAQKAIDAGFAIVKCTPFDEVRPLGSHNDMQPGLHRIQAVSEVLPISQIAIDCHQRLGRFELAELMEWVSESGSAYWIEDPISSGNYEYLARFQTRYSRTRWVSGEAVTRFSDWWELLDSRDYDVLMPDVKHAGGVTQLKMLIPLIEQRGISVSMHNPTSPIGTAFSAHLMTLARTPLPLEFPFNAVQERGNSTIPSEPIVGNMYNLSDNPGIGLRPSVNFLKEYGHKWNKGVWTERCGISSDLDEL